MDNLKEEIVALMDDVNKFMYDVIDNDVPDNMRACVLCIEAIELNRRADTLIARAEGTL